MCVRIVKVCTGEFGSALCIVDGESSIALSTVDQIERLRQAVPRPNSVYNKASHRNLTDHTLSSDTGSVSATSLFVALPCGGTRNIINIE